MRLLNILFAFSFAFCWTKEELSAFVERQVKEKFGEDVRVNKVILLNWDGRGDGVPKVSLIWNTERYEPLPTFSLKETDTLQ
jgi:flagella basal body P-ring formation protein FlgA